MKLIVVTGAKFFDEEIKKILEKAEINIFSRSDISGHKKRDENDISENWFALTNGYQDSIMFFAFTQKNKAKKVLELIEIFNSSLDSESPIRAFILAVESHNMPTDTNTEQK